MSVAPVLASLIGTLTGGAGSKTVYVQFRDDSENISVILEYHTKELYFVLGR